MTSKLQQRWCRKWTGPRAEEALHAVSAHLRSQHLKTHGLVMAECPVIFSLCRIFFVAIIYIRTCSAHDSKKNTKAFFDTRAFFTFIPPSSAHVQLSTSVFTTPSAKRAFFQENNSSAILSSARNPSKMSMGRQRSASTQPGSRTQDLSETAAWFAHAFFPSQTPACHSGPLGTQTFSTVACFTDATPYHSVTDSSSNVGITSHDSQIGGASGAWMGVLCRTHTCPFFYASRCLPPHTTPTADIRIPAVKDANTRKGGVRTTCLLLDPTWPRLSPHVTELLLASGPSAPSCMSHKVLWRVGCWCCCCCGHSGVSTRC